MIALEFKFFDPRKIGDELDVLLIFHLLFRIAFAKITGTNFVSKRLLNLILIEFILIFFSLKKKI